jgi:hypothetical protein
MTLFSNEHVISSSNGGKIILTDQRIHMNETEWGKSYKITLALEDISSIEYLYKSNILWLVLAGISLLFAGATYINGDSSQQGISVYGFAGALLFFIFWVFSKKQMVSITPNGGKSLQFMTENMKEDVVEEFLYKVQLTKAQRIYSLYNEPFVIEEEKKEFFTTTEN